MQYPFGIFANLIASADFSMVAIGRLALAFLTVVAGALLVVRLDQYASRIRTRQEWLSVMASMESRVMRGPENGRHTEIPHMLSRIPFSALAWRQWVGTLNHASGMAVALAAPAIFSLAPLVSPGSPNQAALHVLASLAFFTFLLIPQP